MDWVLENIRLIIIVGGAIAYWLNQRRKAREEQESGDAPPSQPFNQDDPFGEDTERTRRVQEEIRRKILERMGGGMTPPVVAAPPVLQKTVSAQPQQPKVIAPRQPERTEEQWVASDLAMLEHQQQLAARLHELQTQRRDLADPSAAFAKKTEQTMSAAKVAVPGTLLADLRSPASARRAILMREVLGTPVGLR